MRSSTFWGIYFGALLVWAAADLWIYRVRTQPGRELGLAGSLSVWVWALYLTFGVVAGAIYRPFGFQLAAGWRILGLIAALTGTILGLWGMFEFRSLARISALEESRLITTGIYGHVRHPQHAGLLVAAFGLAVAFQTLAGLLTAVVFLLWSLVQTRLEDRRLIVLFGDEARRYIAAVPRYVPQWTAYRGAGGMKRRWLAGLALGGLIVGRRLSAPRQMPHLDVWQRVMTEQRGEVEAAMLAARVQARYDELYAQRPRFSGRALRFHVESNILPALVLYQVLQEAESDTSQEDVLEEVAGLLEVAMRDRLIKRSEFFEHVPRPFAVFRWSARWFMRLLFPPAGWEMEMVEDSDECFAFNVHRCFYLDVLTAYGAPELTRLFCWLDDLAYEALPPTITWERTRTLGRGDDCCDFRWCRVTPEMAAAGS